MWRGTRTAEAYLIPATLCMKYVGSFAQTIRYALKDKCQIPGREAGVQRRFRVIHDIAFSINQKIILILGSNTPMRISQLRAFMAVSVWSMASNTRLIELVARAIHAIAVNLRQSALASIATMTSSTTQVSSNTSTAMQRRGVFHRSRQLHFIRRSSTQYWTSDQLPTTVNGVLTQHP